MNRSALILAAIAAQAHAAPGFLDRFNTAGATAGDDANDPTDLGFHAMPGAPAPEIRQSPGRGGVLATSLSGSLGDRDIYASSSFEPVVLTVDSPVVLGFSMRVVPQPGPGGLARPTFAIGMHNSSQTEVTDSSPQSVQNSLDDRGYHLYLNGRADAQSSVQRDFFPPRLDVESSRMIPGFDYADAEWHDFAFVLRDEGHASFITFDLYIDGRIHAMDEFLQRGVAAFDSVHFGLIQGAMDLELDDIYVSDRIVPAPGPLALLALGASAAAGRRRPTPTRLTGGNGA